jgi:hypothetical protein
MQIISDWFDKHAASLSDLNRKHLGEKLRRFKFITEVRDCIIRYPDRTYLEVVRIYFLNNPQFVLTERQFNELEYHLMPLQERRALNSQFKQFYKNRGTTGYDLQFLRKIYHELRSVGCSHNQSLLACDALYAHIWQLGESASEAIGTVFGERLPELFQDRIFVDMLVEHAVARTRHKAEDQAGI